MYADLVSHSTTPPEYPTQVSPDVRSRYPVSISLKWTEVENPLSGEIEKRQILTIADCGIGMDKEVIERYFLQVGRSFYTTDEFRRRFRFIPTSRFGLGFLSTFAVSDLVTVDTFKPSSIANDGPIRITLTGPRNYLLTERGIRRTAGTQIEVALREPLESGRLIRLVEGWCRRVEFPINVTDLGIDSTVVAESSAQFLFDLRDVSDEQSRLVVRSFPVDQPGIEGDFYVFAKVTTQGEAWDQFTWLTYRYPKTHPGASTPNFPGNLDCIHGIAMTHPDQDYSGRGYAHRIDYRGEGFSVSIAREGRSRHKPDPAVISRWEEILRDHISSSAHSTSEDGWKYRQRLAGIFDFDSFWRSLEGMIPLYIDGKRTMFSLEKAERFQTLTIIIDQRRVNNRYSKEKAQPFPKTRSRTPALFHDLFLSELHYEFLIKPRVPVKISWLNEHYIALDWSLPTNDAQPFAESILTKWFLFDLPVRMSIGCGLNWEQRSQTAVLLNSNHSFVKWLVTLKTACSDNGEAFKIQQFDTLMDLLDSAFRYADQGYIDRLQNYLDRWSNLPGLSLDLYPPKIKLLRDMFKLPYWQD